MLKLALCPIPTVPPVTPSTLPSDDAEILECQGCCSCGNRQNAVALGRGTTGAAENQKKEHAQRRKDYRKWLGSPRKGKLKIVKKFGGTVPAHVSRRLSVPDADYAAFPDTIVEFLVPQPQDNSHIETPLVTVASEL